MFKHHYLLVPALCLFLPLSLAAASLPDTGQTRCDDGANSLVACSNVNSGDASTMPRQDGRFGRDPAAASTAKVGAGQAGFDYTRVCNSGELAGSGACPASPALGSTANLWGCTKDNITGLIWEVKTTDSGLRHNAWTYSWYSSNGSTNAGNVGTPDPGAGSINNCSVNTNCDTEKYIADVNTANLCAANDWRLPSKRELQTLTHLGVSSPSIDTGYFPNTLTSIFWSGSSISVTPSGSASSVNFNDGGDGADGKSNNFAVRLVRGGQF